MRREEFERRLLDFVNRTLLESDPTLAVDADTALFEERVITSLRILELIAFVEKETQAKVPDDAVRLANFRSIRAIAAAFGENEATREDSAAVIRVFERPRRRAQFARPAEELEARGQLSLVTPGRAVLRGSPRRLLGYFDSLARRWAADLGAEVQRYPDLIPAEALLRAGGEAGSTPTTNVVPPAVCYHIYSDHRGASLADRPLLLTARGRCFREEPGCEPSLERLRSFEMREIVALGSREEVERFRQALVARVSEAVIELDLEGRIETASDPFFLPTQRGRRLMQQVLPLKYELRLTLDESGRTCAVASFNHHLDFFGRRFGIRLASGAFAHSGCVAFGLERCVLAFLSQHGTAERYWPEPVRDFCARKEEHARLA